MSAQPGGTYMDPAGSGPPSGVHLEQRWSRWGFILSSLVALAGGGVAKLGKGHTLLMRKKKPEGVEKEEMLPLAPFEHFCPYPSCLWWWGGV